jgi:predicted MFS family arabinose efflux permease
VNAPSVLLVDAATYLVSMTLVGVFVPSRRIATPTQERRGLFAGLRYARKDPLLRAWTAALCLGDAAWYAIFAAIPFLAFTRYQSSAVAGVLLACFGIGSISGNALSFRLVRRLPPIRLVGWGAPFQALPLWLLPIANPAWLVGASLLLSGIANGVANPSLHSIVTLRPPEWARFQVMTAVIVVDSVLGPAGYLFSGLVLGHSGVRTVFVVAAIVQTLAMAVLSGAGLWYYEPAVSAV